MNPRWVYGNSQDGDEVACIRDDYDVGSNPPHGQKHTQRPRSRDLLYALVHQALCNIGVSVTVTEIVTDFILTISNSVDCIINYSNSVNCSIG